MKSKNSYVHKIKFWNSIRGCLLCEVCRFYIFKISILAELVYLIIFCLFFIVQNLLRPPLLSFEVRDDIIFSQSGHDCPVTPHPNCIVNILSFMRISAILRIKKRVKRDFQEDLNDPLAEHFWYVNPYFKSRNDPNDQDSGKIRHMNVTGAWSQGKFSRIYYAFCVR